MSVAPWAAEEEISTQRARDLIAAQFPKLAAEPIEILGEGWDNAAFLVAKRYVFRFPRRAIAAPLIETEARILPRIAPALPAAIPLPIFFGRPQTGYAWRFSGYEMLPGRTACSARLATDDRTRLATSIGTFLRAT